MAEDSLPPELTPLLDLDGVFLERGLTRGISLVSPCSFILPLNESLPPELSQLFDLDGAFLERGLAEGSSLVFPCSFIIPLEESSPPKLSPLLDLDGAFLERDPTEGTPLVFPCAFLILSLLDVCFPFSLRFLSDEFRLISDGFVFFSSLRLEVPKCAISSSNLDFDSI